MGIAGIAEGDPGVTLGIVDAFLRFSRSSVITAVALTSLPVPAVVPARAKGSALWRRPVNSLYPSVMLFAASQAAALVASITEPPPTPSRNSARQASAAKAAAWHWESRGFSPIPGNTVAATPASSRADSASSSAPQALAAWAPVTTRQRLPRERSCSPPRRRQPSPL